MNVNRVNGAQGGGREAGGEWRVVKGRDVEKRERKQMKEEVPLKQKGDRKDELPNEGKGIT